ncbi:protein Niban 2 isoform X2 [Bombina bombina]|nr:protein Niban 2 isoform X2 [Bombina bombina]XP_053551386.1 protein Niban 2 isoform X2 [Bombina bombina]
MGDAISIHLDENRRHHITERTGKLLTEFGKLYEEQYGVALFNSVRYEIEGNGGPQTQLLHRKTPLKDQVIFSGNLFQYIEDTRKWRNRFCLVPHHYGPVLYDNKLAYDRGLQPRAGINCAGYKVLTSLEQYNELLSTILPGGKGKAGNGQLKCATQYPVILWHAYCRHYHFCVMNEREQERWSAVFQDCVRHSNNGIPEESRVESAAFTDSVRLFRQAREQYGTWDMLCGNQVQVLSNLVMDELIPDLQNSISPKLKGKPQDRQRTWSMISDTIYRMVHEQARIFYERLAQRCADNRAEMESQIRTDMDQIISCKEHVCSKIRAVVLPRAELCARNHVQTHIPSILEALMVPTSQGFSEVRDLLFKETTEMNMNLVNGGGREKLAEHMDKLSQLAYHPVKMQQCYDKMDQLNLEGLQQRFDVGSPAVFKQRAQILMREQADNAVYTFEQMVHQELAKSPGEEDLCRDIQRILERVLKKYDYDSSSIRKKFFQEALLQIIIPFLLKKLAPTCRGELPRYQELIFEELSRFVLVENVYEEVVLQSVMRDIVQAVKDAATQRKHNLYRDSMVMHNSDPNLHLLGEGQPIDWSDEYSDTTTEGRQRRLRQVVSIIQDDEGPDILESCQEAPTHEGIPEEPDSSAVSQIRGMLVKEFDVAVASNDIPIQVLSTESSLQVPEEDVVHNDQSPKEHLRTIDEQDSQGEVAQDEDLLQTSQLVVQEQELHCNSQVDEPDETHIGVPVIHSVNMVPNLKELVQASQEMTEEVEHYVPEEERDNHVAESYDLTHGDMTASEDTHENKNANQDVAQEENTSQDENAVQPPAQTLPCPTSELIATILAPPEGKRQSSQTQPSPTYLVQSTPDDSGFQSPLSEEEEETEGYREIPVPAPRKIDEVITPF